MGVDYRFGFGYGIKLTQDDIPADFVYPGELDEYAQLVCEEAVIEAPSIGSEVKYLTIGSEYRQNGTFIIVGFVASYDAYDDPERFKPFEQPSEEQQQALADFAVLRGLSLPQWYGGMYVF